ncbi:MAG: N-acetylmuramoyl-L-alanine amidase [Caulobacter sp. 12-67-6]|nr:MAG: N-acetylmuramoyl-L-alanine amidase [Caulobacter sp. 12-67-6]
MTLPLIEAPSPNFDARKAVPDCVILHYTGMESGEAAIERLRDPEAKVSSHYVVEEDGRIFRLVAEERRAWHAGAAFWKGVKDINSASIGIEIVNPGTRWMISDSRILGHSDIAPARKIDPGELFPWKRLAESGHGLWIEPPPSPGAPLGEGEEGTGVFALQAGLTRLGYDCAPTGKYDAHTTTIVSAFQRHWLQTRFDGIADGETRARLVGLLRAGD